MKKKLTTLAEQERKARRNQYCRCILAVAMLLAGGASAFADGTNTPAWTPQDMFEGGPDTLNNWVEFSVGGLMTSGSNAQAEQRYRLSNEPFGGISDLHLQKDIAKKTTLTVDGHALFDQNDYKLALALKRENFGYVKFDFNEFGTWYNGAGGYYPPTGMQYQLGNDSLMLRRGSYAVEAGLTLKDLPKFVFKYSHSFRDGDKSSTIWGPVHPNLTTTVAGVTPTLLNVNESVDSYALDVTHHLFKTDFGVGVRYDTASLVDTRYETLWQGEPVQRDVTDKQANAYDMFNAHAFSETWFKRNLLLSVGYSFANLNDTFTGNRTYGNDFNVAYNPNPLNGLGYISLNGGAHEQEHVANVNLMVVPVKNLTIVPSLRVQSDSWDASSSGIGTLGTSTGPFTSTSDGGTLEVRECVDARYTGVTNWVYYAGAQLTEGDGNLNQNGGLSQVNGFGVPPVQSQINNTYWFQKYLIGARWYPYRGTSLDMGGYYKRNQYNDSFPVDSTANSAGSADTYPGYLAMQGFQTWDGNLRLTVRPILKLTLVTRYEYQLSTIDTTPDAASGLSGLQSSQMTSHILGQNVSWSPWSRLCLQAGFNYVLSETKTPAADYTQAILNSQNNYWTVTFNSSVVLNDKTDLNVTYLYYRAADFNNNASAGLPLGAGAEEHSVTATLVHRINEHLRVSLKGAWSHYNDWASGGNSNYDAAMVYSTLQYRF